MGLTFKLLRLAIFDGRKTETGARRGDEDINKVTCCKPIVRANFDKGVTTGGN